MKRENGEVFCERCHLIIAPNAPDRLSYGKTDYHSGCYLAYRKETVPRPKVAVDEFRAVVLILFLFFCLAAVSPADAEDIQGCMATYYSQSGHYAFEPFLKVADKESPAEDGAPEVWGFRPWNLEPPDRQGKTHPVNIRDDAFIPMRTFKQVGPRRVKCPDTFWGGG